MYRTCPSYSELTYIRIFSLQLLGDATEQMSLSLGQTLAGLLNATFGNAVEIIVGITALLQDEVRIVQTSVSTRPDLRVTCAYRAQMLGSILSNILLVLGCSFLAGMWLTVVWMCAFSPHRSHIGGIKIHESEFRVTAAQTSVLRFPPDRSLISF